jgi:hypothetical protein
MARVTRSGGQTVSGGGGGGGAGRGLLDAFIADFILDKVGGSIVQGAVNPGGGGLVSPPIPAAQGSKYNLTAPDIIAIQRQVDDENYRRSSTNAAAKALGQDEPFKTYLNANQIISDMVYTNRRLMEEAGARERMLAEVGARGLVQKAQIEAEGATARQAIGSALDAARAIDTELLRRPIDPSLAELSRPI